ncbi:unnamed protein product [Cylicocyclus nassatus]|uniref:Uncharacterized protein n=1 Tax=Cylicocyclus nassatus TaxID=53992 RepID=A0AA36DRU4_CYLNA|nr:unnamed protein product [Cylicocyclus nassatus]
MSILDKLDIETRLLEVYRMGKPGVPLKAPLLRRLPGCDQIFIRRSMTREERDHDRALRQQARDQNSKEPGGGRVFVVYGGQVVLSIICFVNALQTYGAPNSFSVGGCARAPPSFWSAGMQNDNSISDPAPLGINVQVTAEVSINNAHVSDMPPSVGNNPEITKEVPLFKVNTHPPSVIESNSKEPPLFNAYPQADPPTNGFWPDPKAVRDFHKRMKDPTFGSRPENTDMGSRPGTIDLGPGPENVNKQKESAFIHHADNGDYTQPPAPVTFPPFTFRIIAEPLPTSTPTPFFPPPAP